MHQVQEAIQNFFTKTQTQGQNGDTAHSIPPMFNALQASEQLLRG